MFLPLTFVIQIKVKIEVKKTMEMEMKYGKMLKLFDCHVDNKHIYFSKIIV